MAAPHVSGVAALVKQRFPGISVGDLKNHLMNTADDEGAAGADPFYGHGFVNAYRAVTEPLSLSSPSSPSVEAVTIAEGVELGITRKGGSSVPEISFRLRKEGQAQVDLFDLAGRKVASLYSGHAAAGVTTVNWNGRGSRGVDLARGAYFARVSAEGAKASKMLLLGR